MNNINNPYVKKEVEKKKLRREERKQKIMKWFANFLVKLLLK